MPATLVVLEQRLRPDAAATLRYLAEQNVAAKRISGDSAVSVGIATQLSLPRAERPVDAANSPPNGSRWRRHWMTGRCSYASHPARNATWVGALRSRGLPRDPSVTDSIHSPGPLRTVGHTHAASSRRWTELDVASRNQDKHWPTIAPRCFPTVTCHSHPSRTATGGLAQL
jgi:hypothetical protein